MIKFEIVLYRIQIRNKQNIMFVGKDIFMVKLC